MAKIGKQQQTATGNPGADNKNSNSNSNKKGEQQKIENAYKNRS